MIIILAIFYTFSIKDIRKLSQLLNQKKMKLIYSEIVPAGIYGYALVLTNKIVSIGRDGQRNFDLI